MIPSTRYSTEQIQQQAQQKWKQQAEVGKQAIFSRCLPCRMRFILLKKILLFIG